MALASIASQKVLLVDSTTLFANGLKELKQICTLNLELQNETEQSDLIVRVKRLSPSGWQFETDLTRL